MSVALSWHHRCGGPGPLTPGPPANLLRSNVRYKQGCRRTPFANVDAPHDSRGCCGWYGRSTDPRGGAAEGRERRDCAGETLGPRHFHSSCPKTAPSCLKSALTGPTITAQVKLGRGLRVSGNRCIEATAIRREGDLDGRRHLVGRPAVSRQGVAGVTGAGLEAPAGVGATRCV